MNISGAVYFGPSMRAARLLMPDFDETEFLLQLWIAHDFVPQRSASGRDYLNYRLHSRLGSAGNHFLCNVSLEKLKQVDPQMRRCKAHRRHRLAITAFDPVPAYARACAKEKATNT